MLGQKRDFTYTVTLPFLTSKEVINWFESLNSGGILADELVALVEKSIRFDVNEIRTNITPNKRDNITQPSFSTEPQLLSQNGMNLIDSLYNWEESATAVFREEVKGEKKKMLTV